MSIHEPANVVVTREPTSTGYIYRATNVGGVTTTRTEALHYAFASVNTVGGYEGGPSFTLHRSQSAAVKARGLTVAIADEPRGASDREHIVAGQRVTMTVTIDVPDTATRYSLAMAVADVQQTLERFGYVKGKAPHVVSAEARSLDAAAL